MSFIPHPTAFTLLFCPLPSSVFFSLPWLLHSGLSSAGVRNPQLPPPALSVSSSSAQCYFSCSFPAPNATLDYNSESLCHYVLSYRHITHPTTITKKQKKSRDKKIMTEELDCRPQKIPLKNVCEL